MAQQNLGQSSGGAVEFFEIDIRQSQVLKIDRNKTLSVPTSNLGTSTKQNSITLLIHHKFIPCKTKLVPPSDIHLVSSESLIN